MALAGGGARGSSQQKQHLQHQQRRLFGAKLQQQASPRAVATKQQQRQQHKAADQSTQAAARGYWQRSKQLKSRPAATVESGACGADERKCCSNQKQGRLEERTARARLVGSSWNREMEIPEARRASAEGRLPAAGVAPPSLPPATTLLWQQHEHLSQASSAAKFDEGCVKCQLIARWTSAQARQQQQEAVSRRIRRGEKRLQETARPRGSGDGQENVERGGSAAAAGSEAEAGSGAAAAAVWRRRPQRAKVATSETDKSKAADKLKAAENDETPFGNEQSWSKCRPSAKQDGRTPTAAEHEHEDEISSLTESSLGGEASLGEDGQNDLDYNENNSDEEEDEEDHDGDDDDDHDEWSLSSCYEEFTRRRRQQQRGGRQAVVIATPVGANHQQIGRLQQQQHFASRLASVRLRRLPAVASAAFNASVAPFARRRRRPAPAPPTHAQMSTRHAGDKATASAAPGADGTSSKEAARAGSPNLLSETEIFSIEHCLKSHKSALYVCGCMANLYLTSTRLVDNGRCSEPAGEGWRLSKTGVPVLTFDSGLTRNRTKRRLSINLTERGSGFVLWSDTIDHLSNYRAFETRKFASDSRQQTPTDNKSRPRVAQAATCDTFHVMYLSTNHRVMVGLSFDDAACARLFLSQVELVTSDPANIALTGPKLARRLASFGRIGRLLLSSSSRAAAAVRPLEAAKRTKSIGSIAEHQANVEQQQLPLWASGTCIAAATNLPNRDEGSVIDANDARSSTKQSSSSCVGERGSSELSRPVSQPELSAGVDCTWSTLRRAIRFGAQQKQQLLRLRRPRSQAPDIRQGALVAAGDAQASGPPPAAPACPAALRPRQLVSLAMAGRVFRAGKRMPRKCDISAPCLFQHVAHVDLADLDGLYSKSLVSGSLAGSATESARAAAAASPSEAPLLPPPPTATSPEPPPQRRPLQQRLDQQQSRLDGVERNTSTANKWKLSMISADSERPGAANSSSSSCYSSASISPTSSECGTRGSGVGVAGGRGAPPTSAAGSCGESSGGDSSIVAAASGRQRPETRQQQRRTVVGGNVRIRAGGSRPPPPRVPPRSCGPSPEPPAPPAAHHLVAAGPTAATATRTAKVAAAKAARLSAAGGGFNSDNNNSSNGKNKIQDIMRELESQTSAELVDAKRRLMADIAGQVMARAASAAAANRQPLSTAAAKNTSSNRGGHPHGTVSHL